MHKIQKFWQPTLIGILLASVAGMSMAAPVLISGEWPPYTGEHEPKGGKVTAVIRQVFARQGERVNIGVFPWGRVQRMIRFNRSFVGKFPVYYSEARAAECYLSQAVGESPLGLAERKTKPVKWAGLEDFSHYRVGVVGTYENTPAFDELVVQGKISTLVAFDDEENLRNLQSGKVDVAIVDRNVFEYFAKKPAMQSFVRQLQLNSATVVVHKLHVCFQKTEEGRDLRDRFDAGLRRLQASTTSVAR